MSYSKICGVAIKGIATCVPSTIRTNSDIGGLENADYVDSLSEKVGVEQRRVVLPGEYGSDLAMEAIEKLINTLGWSTSSIDLVIVATQTPDNLFPGISFRIHKELGLSTNCTVFDINLGCSAFTHGLWVTSTLLQGVGTRAILVNVDTMSRTIAHDDYGNQVLFGDAGAATALEIEPSANPLHFVSMSDGRGINSVTLVNSAMKTDRSKPSYFQINGPAVLGLALRAVPKLIHDLLDQSEISLSEIGVLIPHQANTFILKKLIQQIDFDENKSLIAMKDYGNTSSASIPLAITASREVIDQLDKRHSLMVGFGTGFSVSGVIADLNNTKILDVSVLENHEF